LKRSLIDLNQTSVTTAERLDGLYRSVQQKAAVLQSTVTALWELAGMSQDVKQTFNRETRELVSDVEEQLDTFGSFEEQQRTIGQLQERILLGRRRITVLSDRIDGVQDKIERWERADREWQERTRNRRGDRQVCQ
jgi:septal ring factor EnvC (AmiA/AmiB activator)